MKFWVSKYALSSGIREIDVEPDPAFPTMLIERSGSLAQSYHGDGRDWHRSLEGAMAKAEEMRLAKIKSLQKQIAKLEKLSFGAKP